jgi:dipeptidyl aminopeptidase/acylaminoacyl peptidase
VTETGSNLESCTKISDYGLLSEHLQDTQILYQGFNENLGYKQIWVVALKDGSRNLLVEKYPVANNDLVFLLDGDRFVWKDDDRKVWLSDLDGNQPVQVLPIDFLGDFIPYSAKWSAFADPQQYPEAVDYWKGKLHSPDGEKIAIWEGDPALAVQTPLIIRDKRSGNEFEVLGFEERSFLIEGNWSPNGKLFAFSQMFFPLEGIENRQGQIYVVNSDGSNLLPITQLFDSATPHRPIWSPDGEKIAFLIWEYDQWPNPSIGIATLATGEVVLKRIVVGQSVMSHGDIVWSPDSAWIAFFTPINRDIRILNIKNDEVFCVTYDGDAIVENIMDWR